MKAVKYIFMIALMNSVFVFAANACPDLQGEYVCAQDGLPNSSSRKKVVQGNIADGIKYSIAVSYDGSEPDMTAYGTENFYTDGKVYEDQFNFPQAPPSSFSCGADYLKASVSYLYWGVNPMHQSQTITKLANGDLKIEDYSVALTQSASDVVTVCKKLN